MGVVRSLLTSKKFVAALVAMAVWVGGYAGLDLSVEQVTGFISPLLAFIVGQGVADLGKGAEQTRREL